MKPAVREVDELLALGVSVTVYNGQVSTKDYSPQHFWNRNYYIGLVIDQWILTYTSLQYNQLELSLTLLLFLVYFSSLHYINIWFFIKYVVAGKHL